MLDQRKPPGDFSEFPDHQAVVIAVEIQIPALLEPEPAGGGTLRIQLDQLEPVRCHIGQKGDVVGLGHGVVDGHILFILHRLHGDGVGVVRFFRFQRGQGNAAAADHRFAGGVNHIAADGADVESGAQQIGRTVPIDNGITGEQLHHRNAQGGGQRFQQREIGKTLGRFPFGDGLVADVQQLGQTGLGQSSCFAQPPDGAAGYISVHKVPPKSIGLCPYDSRPPGPAQPTPGRDGGIYKKA